MISPDQETIRAELEERLRFETFLVDLSAQFINLPADQVDRMIVDAQRRICELLGLDLCVLWQWAGEDRRYLYLSHYSGELTETPPERMIAQDTFPWFLQEFQSGRELVFNSMDDLPPEAARDRQSFQQYGVETVVAFPLMVGGEPYIGVLSFSKKKAGRDWPEETVSRLRLMAGIFANAIARKRLDEILREREERLSLAADAAGAGLWILDAETGIFWITEQIREVFAFPKGIDITMPIFLAAVHPEDRERIQRTVEDSLREKRDVQTEYRVICPDQSVRWISSRGRPNRFLSGKTDRLMGISIDITARKRTEAALAESESLKTDILSSLASQVAVVDRAGRIVMVNEAWRRFGEENGGVEADSAPGTDILAAIERAAESGSEDAARASAGIRKVLAGSVDRFRYDYASHSPGRQDWFIMTVTPLRGPSGGAVISHTNVTELKESQLALARACDEIAQLKERLQQENIYLRQEISLDHARGEIIGRSEAIRQVLRLAGQVAPTNSSVLIQGETGTGKELVARLVHQLSPRHGYLMVKVNCTALPATLIESELFGREKGAYTGALTRQTGRFEVANGSTLFLDEIGELPLELQAKLLQVIQEGRFERLGSTKTISVDVRVIAATNRDLAEEVRRGRFRQDLYYRINVFPIQMPPLRERIDDIPLMVNAFVDEFAGKFGRKISRVPRRVMDAMLRYAWPGNIRELRNVIERAVIVSPGDTLAPDLPSLTTGDAPAATTLAEAEARHISATLKRTGGRIKGANGAAALLGMKPSTLYTRMKKLGIHARDQEEGASIQIDSRFGES